MRMLLTTVIQLYVFVLAGFVGYQVISRVPPLLHTPLMSAANAITGISLVGSLVAAGSNHGRVSNLLGFIAVPMTVMPQWVALSHAAGAVAATLVGVNEYLQLGAGTPHGTMAALGFEVFLGALTVTGSVMAFGKLQEILPGRPVVWPLQN